MPSILSRSTSRMPETGYFPDVCWVKAKFELLTDGCGTLFFTGGIWCVDCNWFIWFIIRSRNIQRVILTNVGLLSVFFLYFIIGLTKVNLSSV